VKRILCSSDGCEKILSDGFVSIGNDHLITDWLILGNTGAGASTRGAFEENSPHQCNIDAQEPNNCNIFDMVDDTWREGTSVCDRTWVKYKDSGNPRSSCHSICNNNIGVNLGCHFSNSITPLLSKFSTYGMTYIYSETNQNVSVGLGASNGYEIAVIPPKSSGLSMQSKKIFC
jgi:hypothetical protein